MLWDLDMYVPLITLLQFYLYAGGSGWARQVVMPECSAETWTQGPPQLWGQRTGEKTVLLPEGC